MKGPRALKRLSLSFGIIIIGAITGSAQADRPAGSVDVRPPRPLEITLEHPRAHERKERILHC